LHTATLLDDYIKEAEAAGQLTKLSNNHRYSKFHRSLSGNLDPNAPDSYTKEACSRKKAPGCPDDYLKVLPLDDPLYYGPQPYVPGTANQLSNLVVNGVEMNRKYMWQYHVKDTAIDVRAVFKSEKYPWIISVARYDHHLDKADDADMARMQIPWDPKRGPKGDGTGMYIVHWVWSGFYDCTDIQGKSHRV
jgi:hypothetical protein